MPLLDIRTGKLFKVTNRWSSCDLFLFIHFASSLIVWFPCLMQVKETGIQFKGIEMFPEVWLAHIGRKQFCSRNFRFSLFQLYWKHWRKMGAQLVTVRIADDLQKAQKALLHSQRGKAKNLEEAAPLKASPKSRWKVCKGEASRIE